MTIGIHRCISNGPEPIGRHGWIATTGRLVLKVMEPSCGFTLENTMDTSGAFERGVGDFRTPSGFLLADDQMCFDPLRDLRKFSIRHLLSENQNRHLLAGVIGSGVIGIIAVIGG